MTSYLNLIIFEYIQAAHNFDPNFYKPEDLKRLCGARLDGGFKLPLKLVNK